MIAAVAMTVLVCWQLVVQAKSNCPIDFSGQRDVIFLFDTSTSVNEEPLEYGRDVGLHLVRTAMLLRPEAVHLAAVTFSQDVEVAFSFIGPLTSNIYECELFAPGGIWETSITFKSETGENLAGGLDRAAELFKQGSEARKDVAQDLIIVSDAHELFRKQETFIEDRRQDMINFGINIYGIGVGGHLNSSVFEQKIASMPCFYKTAQQWMDFNLANLTSALTKTALKQEGAGAWREVTNASICDQPCGEGRVCACQEFSNVAMLMTPAQCIEPKEVSHDPVKTARDETLWLALIGLLFALLGVFFLIALVACIMWTKGFIKDRRHPLRHLQSNSFREEEGNEYQQQRSNLRRQEDIYQNGIVATVLRGHSLEHPQQNARNVRRNVNLPQTPEVDQNDAYMQAEAMGGRPLSEPSLENVYANISTPDLNNLREPVSQPGVVESTRSLDSAPAASPEYENEAYINELSRRFRQNGHRPNNGHHSKNLSQKSSDQSLASQRSKKRSSWLNLFKNSKHDYVNEDAIEQLRQNAGKSTRRKVGTTRFKSLRNLFEGRKEVAEAGPAPAREAWPSTSPPPPTSPATHLDTGPRDNTIPVFNVV